MSLACIVPPYCIVACNPPSAPSYVVQHPSGEGEEEAVHCAHNEDVPDVPRVGGGAGFHLQADTHIHTRWICNPHICDMCNAKSSKMGRQGRFAGLAWKVPMSKLPDN
jgi:hypothetical protein